MAKKKTTTKAFGEDRWIVTKARYLRMLAPHVSKEETRYYLGGIYIAPAKKGIYLVATDGHRMGVIHDEHGKIKGEPFICPVSPAILAATKKKADRLSDVAVFDGQRLRIVSGKYDSSITPDTARTASNHSEELPPIDGTYPQWRRVIPKRTPVRFSRGHFNFNPEYVGSFARVPLLANGVSDGASLFPGVTEGDPVIIRFQSVPEFMGVLMGMKISDIPALPDWLPKAA